MMKYFVVACLLLTVALVQAQEQETTTDKRVERDLGNMQEMAQIPLAIPEAMADAASKFADGMKSAFNNAAQMMPGMNGMGGTAPSKRRRAAQL